MTAPLPLLAALLAPAMAGAQVLAIPSVQADPVVLLACLETGKNSRTCLGAMTLDCLAENEIGNENLEERLCVDEELAVWRDLVRRAGARVLFGIRQVPPSDRPALSGDPAEQVKAAEAAWGDWVETQCRLERIAAGGSDRRAIIEDTCLRDLTAARYDRLQHVSSIVEGK